ncbi:MAG: STAS domain-containing protein [Gemmatimonadetes bacterium]|nr:STAS domain-containing protein [Gemmatimonadota bacterium]MCC6770496.1 STAS domain-containing protein [Gemmatimonadaceae bacterium]
MTAVAESTSLLAPSRLVAETRVDFRCAALESLDRAGEHGSSLLAIDMTGTRDVDASGLGILVLVQKRARERGLKTQLLNTQHSVRSLLTLTKLEGLFEFA